MAKIIHKDIYEQGVKESHFEGKTLSQIIEELGYSKGNVVVHTVTEGSPDTNVDSKFWDYIKPTTGTFVIIGFPAGDNALRSVLTLALIIAAPHLAPELVGIIGGTEAAATALIVFGGTLLINAMVPYATPSALTNNSPSESATLSISGSQNKISVGKPFAYHIGTNKFVPPLAAQPVRKAQGKDVYYEQVFAVGYPCLISDIKIGDTAIENFENYELQVYDGITNLNPITTIKGDVTTQPSTSLLLLDQVSQLVTTALNCEHASLVFAFNQGLVSIDSQTGRYYNTKVDVSVEYRKVGDVSWSTLYGKTVADNITVNAFRNPSTVSLQARDREDNITFVTQTVTNSYLEFPAGIPAGLTVGESFPISTSDNNNNAVYEILSISGNKAYVSGYAIQPLAGLGASSEKVIPLGKSLQNESDISVVKTSALVGVKSFTDATAKTTYRTIDIPNLPKAQYDFKITRQTPDSANTYLRNDITLIDVVSTQLTDDNGDTLVSFPPQFAYIGLRIKATDQLNGVISQLSCTTTSAPYAYDTDTLTWSQGDGLSEHSGNPAWEYVGILNGGACKRPVDNLDIDLLEFSDWADRCNESVNGKPRHRINHVVDYKIVQRELMTKVASIGRASRTMIDGVYSVVQDVGGKSSVQKFTPMNSYGFKASKSFALRPDAFKCQFVNPDKDWSLDYVQIKRDDSVADADIKVVEDLDCTGITDIDELYRYAKFAHAQIELRPEEYKLSTGIENVRCTRGDVITVAHDKIQGDVHFGRVLNFDNTGIILDNIAGLGTPSDYYVTFRHATSTQTTATYPVLSQVGNDYTIDFGGTYPSDLKEGDIAIIGTTVEQINRKYIVKTVTNKDDLNAEFSLVDYADPDIYSSESGVIPEYNTGFTKPIVKQWAQPLAPIIETYYSDEKALKISSDGTLSPRIAIELFREVDDTRPEPESVSISYKISGTDGYFVSEPLQLLDSSTYYCNQVVEGLSYDIRVSYVTAVGVQSEFTKLDNVSVSGKTNPPPDVEDFFVSRLPNGVRRFIWKNLSELDIRGYDIRYGNPAETNWDNLIPIPEGVINTNPYETNQIAAGTYAFAIKAVDTSGNESLNATFLITTLGSQALENAVRYVEYPLLDAPYWGVGVFDNCLEFNKAIYAQNYDWSDPIDWTSWTSWDYLSGVEWSFTTEPIDAGTNTYFTPLITPNVVATFEMSTSLDDITYTAFGPISEVYARYVKIKVTSSAPIMKKLVIILDGKTVQEYVDDLDTTLHSSPAGDFRVPLEETFKVINYVGVTLQNVGAGWTFEVIDKNPTLGPRIKIYNNLGVTADCIADIFVRGV